MVPENTIMAAPTHHNLAHPQTTPNKLATYQKWLQTIEKPLQTLQEPRGASCLPPLPSEARRPCRQPCTTSSTPPSTISRASPRRSTSASATNWTAARSGPRPTAPRPLPGKLPTASRVRTRTVCSDRARRTRSSTRRTASTCGTSARARAAPRPSRPSRRCPRSRRTTTRSARPCPPPRRNSRSACLRRRRTTPCSTRSPTTTSPTSLVRGTTRRALRTSSSKSSTRASTRRTPTSSRTSGLTRARSAATASTPTARATIYWAATGTAPIVEVRSPRTRTTASGSRASPAATALLISLGFGDSNTGGFAEALVYGADNGAQISSNSWGYTSPDVYEQAVLDAIDYYNDMGGIVVFAAGNSNSEACYYPGCYDGVVGVAALDNGGTRASFSNYGEWVDISAPGVDVMSTMTDEGYGTASGTSMACPHVAGILALGKSANPNASKGELLHCLYDTAADITSENSASMEGKLGKGLVDAEAFVDCCVEGAPTAAPTITVPPTSAAPSMKPTTSMAPTENRLRLHIEIQTDNYPQETTWTLDLVEGDADECDWPGEKAGGPFNSDEPYIEQEVALPRGACTYRWAIYDAWGDGNCCAFGEGYYKLRIDGEVVMEGGDFGRFEVHVFSSARAPTLSPTVAALPAPTVRPTPRPIPAPTLRPTVSGGDPTLRPTPRPTMQQVPPDALPAPTYRPTSAATDSPTHHTTP